MIKCIIPTAPGSGLEGFLSIYVYYPVNEYSGWEVLSLGEDGTEAVCEPLCMYSYFQSEHQDAINANGTSCQYPSGH